MKTLITTFPLLAALAASAAPSVTITGIGQDDSFNRIKVSYTLSEDAIVTWSAKTNSAEVSPSRTTRVWGDVNRKVAAPGGAFWWAGAEELDDFGEVTATLEITLTAWPTNSPPDYMVVDCAGKSNVTYYVSAEAVPLGVTNEVYKTTKMVLRRIPAKGVTWTMGSPPEEADRDATYEVRHQVTLTEDYYMGIYPVTQGQYHSLVGNNPSSFKGAANSKMRPVETVSYYDIRGNGNGVCWAATNPSHRVSGPLLSMRNATGVKFDLPTDAQWEYACRAGTSSRFNNGTGSLDDSGWHAGNWQNDPACTSNETHVVGLLKPNNWGLYDMHGNVAEWVLDWHGPLNTTAAVEDPAGANTAGDNYHFTRGAGSWGTEWTGNTAAAARSARHGGWGAFWYRSWLGFRVVAPAAGYWKHE